MQQPQPHQSQQQHQLFEVIDASAKKFCFNAIIGKAVFLHYAPPILSDALSSDIDDMIIINKERLKEVDLYWKEVLNGLPIGAAEFSDDDAKSRFITWLEYIIRAARDKSYLAMGIKIDVKNKISDVDFASIISEWSELNDIITTNCIFSNKSTYSLRQVDKINPVLKPTPKHVKLQDRFENFQRLPKLVNDGTPFQIGFIVQRRMDGREMNVFVPYLPLRSTNDLLIFLLNATHESSIPRSLVIQMMKDNGDLIRNAVVAAWNATNKAKREFGAFTNGIWYNPTIMEAFTQNMLKDKSRALTKSLVKTSSDFIQSKMFNGRRPNKMDDIVRYQVQDFVDLLMRVCMFWENNTYEFEQSKGKFVIENTARITGDPLRMIYNKWVLHDRELPEYTSPKEVPVAGSKWDELIIRAAEQLCFNPVIAARIIRDNLENLSNALGSSNTAGHLWTKVHAEYFNQDLRELKYTDVGCMTRFTIFLDRLALAMKGQKFRIQGLLLENKTDRKNTREDILQRWLGLNDIVSNKSVFNNDSTFTMDHLTNYIINERGSQKNRDILQLQSKEHLLFEMLAASTYAVLPPPMIHHIFLAMGDEIHKNVKEAWADVRYGADAPKKRKIVETIRQSARSAAAKLPLADGNKCYPTIQDTFKAKLKPESALVQGLVNVISHYVHTNFYNLRRPRSLKFTLLIKIYVQEFIDLMMRVFLLWENTDEAYAAKCMHNNAAKVTYKRWVYHGEIMLPSTLAASSNTPSVLGASGDGLLTVAAHAPVVDAYLSM
jgi:hypothetical protein